MFIIEDSILIKSPLCSIQSRHLYSLTCKQLRSLNTIDLLLVLKLVDTLPKIKLPNSVSVRFGFPFDFEYAIDSKLPDDLFVARKIILAKLPVNEHSISFPLVF